MVWPTRFVAVAMIVSGTDFFAGSDFSSDFSFEGNLSLYWTRWFGTTVWVPPAIVTLAELDARFCCFFAFGALGVTTDAETATGAS